MAGGKRYKLQGSTIEIQTGYEGSPLGTVTGITQANPAVVSQTAHGFATGDVVKLDDVVGMDEVNEGVYAVDVIDANSYRLVDVDSTGYGAYVSGGTANGATFSNLCELTNYNRQGGTSPEIPATTVCSDAQEFEVGLPDFGTTALDFNFAPRTEVQTAMQAAYLAGDPIAVRVTLPKQGGYMVQLGTVQQTSETAGVGGLWTASATIRNTGQRFDIEA